MEIMTAQARKTSRKVVRAGAGRGFVSIMDGGTLSSGASRAQTASGAARRQPAGGVFAPLFANARPGTVLASTSTALQKHAVCVQSTLNEKVSTAVKSTADALRNTPNSMLATGRSLFSFAGKKSGKKVRAAPALSFAPAALAFIDALPEKIAQGISAATAFFANSRKRLIGLVAGVILALSMAAGGSYYMAASTFPMPAGSILPDEDSAQNLLMTMVFPETDTSLSEDTGGPLPPLPVLLKMRSYTVKSSDSLAAVAKRFGVRADTIISLNNLKNSQSFKAGIHLRIPNMDGLSYRVRSNDSLNSVAKAYRVEVTRIADANDLASASLQVGQTLFIPGARMSQSSLKGFYGETTIWPARGTISSPFGYRANPFSGARTFHAAIDIVLNRGTPVKACMDGKVADTGYNSVFGNYIILSHSGGYQSLYGHLDQILVKNGQQAGQGTLIGKSGNTGQSTGPHLHFGLFKNGKAIDPRTLLK